MTARRGTADSLRNCDRGSKGTFQSIWIVSAGFSHEDVLTEQIDRRVLAVGRPVVALSK